MMFPGTADQVDALGLVGQLLDKVSSGQQGRQDHLYRQSHAVVVPSLRPEYQHRPSPDPTRSGGEDANRPAQPALSARPSDPQAPASRPIPAMSNVHQAIRAAVEKGGYRYRWWKVNDL